jgi:hypothetical protein
MQTLFFATKNDLLPLMATVEAEMPVKYVETGLFSSNEPRIHMGAEFLPNLGAANHESAINCVSYLVMPREATVEVRRVSQEDGTYRYAIDQQENADSIQLQPGGAFSSEVFLHGRIATVSASRVSGNIYRIYRTAIKTRYMKVKAFYVSEQCMHLYERGVRLTIAAQSPRDVDLVVQGAAN